MKKGNISIFVPHLGCPCRCSFCNQNTITGKAYEPTADDVVNAVEKALEKDNFSYEIAFFGGSFTAIPREYMVSLLESAYVYVKAKKVDGIRISTRPDSINEEILTMLKKYGVTSIELGCQSMDEQVLSLNRRGHTSEDVINACKLIKKFGFQLGVQMMTGLYGDTDEKAIKTAESLIALKPDTVRIYPTVVLPSTYLASLYLNGTYEPQTVESAVALAAILVPMFEKNNIKVIRLGLHSSEDIKNEMLSGAFHPAFGELVRSKIICNKLEALTKGDYSVFVNPKSLSRFIGNKKSNLIYLQSKGINIKFITQGNVAIDDMRIENGIKNT